MVVLKIYLLGRNFSFFVKLKCQRSFKILFGIKYSVQDLLYDIHYCARATNSDMRKIKQMTSGGPKSKPLSRIIIKSY